MNQKLSGKISRLEALNPSMQNQDYLLTWQKKEQEIKSLLLTAEILMDMHKAGNSTRIFNSGLAISIFRDNSTRTRFSYASAVNLLGLGLSELDEEKSQVAHGETVMETANMISFLTEAIGIRDDMYLGEGNSYMEKMIEAVTFGYDQGILHQKPTIVNLQSDIDHPTQTLADLSKLSLHFGGLENLRGKKLAMSWAYSPSYGKPLSVPQGIIGLMTRFGMEVTLAYPEGYDLLPDVTAIAEKNAEESGGQFRVTSSMADAFKDADVVYPKSWAPFQVMERRTELLKKKDRSGLVDLERECLDSNARYTDWECNEDMMALTRNGSALYQHCLPADISGVSCETGEVSANVFNRYKVDTYQQAGYKPFIIAAMIFLSKVKNPAATLKELLKK